MFVTQIHFENFYGHHYRSTKGHLYELGLAYTEALKYFNMIISSIIAKKIDKFRERDNLKYVGISMDQGFLMNFTHLDQKENNSSEDS